MAPASIDTAGAGCNLPFAAGADEGVVQGDRVHLPRPDQQRVGRVRRPLIAVAAALHHQPQIVLPREIDRGDDVRRRLGGDRVDARLRRPGPDPAERLRQPDFVAEIVRILELLEDLRASRVRRRADAGGERRAHLDEASAHFAVELIPAFLRRPRRVAGTDAGRGRGRVSQSRRARPEAARKRQPGDDPQADAFDSFCRSFVRPPAGWTRAASADADRDLTRPDV